MITTTSNNNNNNNNNNDNDNDNDDNDNDNDDDDDDDDIDNNIVCHRGCDGDGAGNNNLYYKYYKFLKSDWFIQHSLI